MMKDYTQIPYLMFTDSGEITQTGKMPAFMFDLQSLESNTHIMEGTANRNTNYIQDGRILEYTNEELEAKSKIKPGWSWKMPERRVVDMRQLHQAKDDKWKEIKTARDIAENGTFVCDGAVYQTNKERVTEMAMLAFMAQSSGQPFSEEWILADNTVKVLDADGMIAVGVAQGAHTAAVFAKSKYLREQIAAATTNAQVDLISWTD